MVDSTSPSFAHPSSASHEPKTVREQAKLISNSGLIGRYVYCIVEGEVNWDLGAIGIDNLPVHTIYGYGVTALVSSLVYKQMTPNLEQVVSHQRVVEAARTREGTDVVLPVRFGVVIKGEEGVRKLLQTSAPQYKEKMRELRGRDEIGIKVILNKEDAANFRKSVEIGSEHIQKLKDEIASAPNQGRSYFLKMKLQDAIKTETLKRIGEVASTIHKELSDSAERAVMLKSDVGQVILNASYLVERSSVNMFEQKIAEQKQRFSSYGLTIHLSGPWAPYSFC